MKKNIRFKAKDKDTNQIIGSSIIIDMFDEEDEDEARNEVRNYLIEHGYNPIVLSAEITDDVVYTIFGMFDEEVEETIDEEEAMLFAERGYTVEKNTEEV